MKTRCALTLVAVAACVRAEDGWVWSSNGRSLDGPSYRPNDDRRPGGAPSRFTDYNRPPAPIYESNNGDVSPPPFRPPPPSYRPGVRPPGGGILTGPNPSWERRDPAHKYRDYDHCKCAFSFNCASPGILFGSCDVDKQYCCNDEKQGRYDLGGPRFEGPRYDRPVLVGPGGDDGRPPRYDRPVLVGPGGGREDGRPPRYDRPVLVGPGGPTGVPGGYGSYGGGYGGGYQPQRGDRFYEPYARSSGVDAKATKN